MLYRILLAFLTFTILLSGCSIDNQKISSELVSAADPVAALVGGQQIDLSGFTRAAKPADIRFPRDHGAHPDYQTEWWYFTGNLETQNGRRFGYQFTIFRRALLPPDQRVERESFWAADQVYMAHFAISDIESNQHVAFERFNRAAVDLAGAEIQPFRVWLEDWQVQEISPDRYRLTASSDQYHLDITLRDVKGPILHGENGYSQKGAQPGNASNYYSFTRLESNGVLRIGDTEFDVVGFSWMDHEYSTSALTADQIGWDWFSLQFASGSELMVFQIRLADGGIDPYSSGSFIDSLSEVTHLSATDFNIAVQDYWQSPDTGANYPAGWLLEVPSQNLLLNITPLIADQELNVTYSYWEGAVEFSGTLNGEPQQGYGYVELTGY